MSVHADPTEKVVDDKTPGADESPTDGDGDKQPNTTIAEQDRAVADEEIADDSPTQDSEPAPQSDHQADEDEGQPAHPKSEDADEKPDEKPADDHQPNATISEQDRAPVDEEIAENGPTQKDHQTEEDQPTAQSDQVTSEVKTDTKPPSDDGPATNSPPTEPKSPDNTIKEAKRAGVDEEVLPPTETTNRASEEATDTPNEQQVPTSPNKTISEEVRASADDEEMAVEPKEPTKADDDITDGEHIIEREQDAETEQYPDTDTDDPWIKVTEGRTGTVTTATDIAWRPTVHYVIEGSAEGQTNRSDVIKSYFIMSSMGTSRNTKLVTICPLTGTLVYEGIWGTDIFKSEGDARAYLTDKLGLRIINCAKGPALIGVALCGSRLNICVVTKSEARLHLPTGDPVYTIVDVKWVPVKLAYPTQGQYQSIYSGLVTDFNICNLHYYTQPFVDVTHPFPSVERVSDPNYIWNGMLQEPFKKIGLGSLVIDMIQGLARSSFVGLGMTRIPTGMRRRLTRFYLKYNKEKLDSIPELLTKYSRGQEQLFKKLIAKYGPEPEADEELEGEDPAGYGEEKASDANYCLLTRRLCRHAGTRYNARGIDQFGHVANELECELILSSGGKFSSFLWRRGSVPIGWYSSLGRAVKVGQATFLIKDNPYESSNKYWDSLARRFAGWGEDGKAPPVTCLSLLHTEPEHGELLLVEHFQESLRAVKSKRPTTNVDLFGFDWHRTVKLLGLTTAVEGAWALLAGPLKSGGATVGTINMSYDNREEFTNSAEANSSLTSMSVTPGSPTSEPKKKKQGAFGMIRGLVSQQKLRFQDGGFNLDLTYITPRIIAMGFPSSGAEGYYRNPVDEVEKFFETRHKGHYRIYNLCSEREYDSDSRFRGCYLRMPFEDHNAPAPISIVPDLVKDAMTFLKEDPENVVSVHCKAGKGRTGLMICAILMAGAEPDLVPPASAAAALGFFGAARTKDGLGVTIPSQRRYLSYYQESLLKNHGVINPNPLPLRIAKIVIQSPIKQSTSPYVYVLVHDGPKWVKTKLGSQQVERDTPTCKWDSRKVESPQQAGARFTLFDLEEGKDGSGPIIRGDTKISFMSARSMLRDEHLFHLWFHTSFINVDNILKGEPLRFNKSELDKACKDEKHSSLRRDLQVEVYLQLVNGQEAPEQEQEGEKEEPVPKEEEEEQTEAAPLHESEDGSDENEIKTNVTQRQSGILRLNCVDSLDRTNLASFFVALQVSGELRRLLRNDPEPSFPFQSKTLSQVRSSLGDDLVGFLAEAFVSNGDVCSLLYTNTPATHTDAIREMSPKLSKAQSNAMLSVMRRYQNTVNDTARHNGILAFLGLLKKPPHPPEVMTGASSSVISADLKHIKETSADPTSLLTGLPVGDHPWITKSEATRVIILLPAGVGAVTEVSLCFRNDPTGDDEGYPTRLEVETGSNLNSLNSSLPVIAVPRAADHSWLTYELQSPSRSGDRLICLSLSGCLASQMILGGFRVLGCGSEKQQNQDTVSSFPCDLIQSDEERQVFAPSGTFLIEAIEFVQGEFNDDIAIGIAMNLSGGPEVAFSRTDSMLKLDTPAKGRLVTVKNGPSDLKIVVHGKKAPMAFKTPPPPSSGLSLRRRQLSRKKARVLATVQDDEMLGALFVLIADSNVKIVGIRISTAAPKIQSKGILVGVADDPAVQTLPSSSARSAIINYAEDFAIPACAEGTVLDYHFSQPVKGSLVRIEVQPLTVDSSFVALSRVSVLIES
eukprot:TRINITY_DN7732_c0_g2_i2.p1 TRINITY_DN7732_c0_g2~~TRINITY_DN7732_c0_g2_i2.p1  ORF type:complete len:1740 (+),score=347.92 TRINITY_DN7732_c0_g2_i2:40-5259(+)